PRRAARADGIGRPSAREGRALPDQGPARPGAKPAGKAAAPAAKGGAKAGPAAAAPGQKAGAENAVAWDPRKVRMFLTGVITLGELEGISKEEQYEIAEIGHQHLQQAHHEQAKQIFEGLAVLDPHDAYFQLALGSV